jgi:glycosyltransferase involved in cell wall biosynthesis
MIENVSIILPVYNAGKYLDEAISSILNQSHKNFELLIVDDGSTDNSLQIIENCSKNDNRVKVYVQKNFGKCFSINKLANLAKYEWLIFMDADDVMELNRIETQVKFHNINVDIHASSSNCQYIDHEGRYLGKQIYRGLSSREEIQKRYINYDFVLCAFTGLMIEKKYFLSIGGLRQEFWSADDVDFINRFIEHNYKLIIINEFLMKYRIHHTSFTGKNPISNYFSTLYCNYCKGLRKLNLSEISFVDFQIEFRKKPILYKFNWYKSRYAMIFHKNAGFKFYQKKYISFLINITIATSLWPSYVFASFKNQFKK